MASDTGEDDGADVIGRDERELGILIDRDHASTNDEFGRELQVGIHITENTQLRGANMRNCKVGALSLVFVAGLLAGSAGLVGTSEEPFRVSNRALHDGRINPMLFGNFIELLDDLVPGMWAEMLNDRGFEGVVPPANWVYYDGLPTFCDRAWETNKDSTTTESEQPFTGRKCAKIVSHGKRQSQFSQSGVAVKRGARYVVSGWIRSEGAVRVQVDLASRGPDGSTIELAATGPWEPSAKYTRWSSTLEPNGSSNHAVFVLRLIGQGTVWVDQM